MYTENEPNKLQDPIVVHSSKMPSGPWAKGIVYVVFTAIVVLILFWLKDGIITLLPVATAEPWSHASKTLADPPPAPAKEELVALFVNARKAMETNEKTDTYLSTSLLWQAKNNVKSTEKVRDGLPVNIVEPRDPKDFYQQIFGTMPPSDAIEFSEVVVLSKTGELKNPEFYIENPSSGLVRRFIVTRWRYSASLTAFAIAGDGEKKKGDIRFVYDNGAWKYQFENWTN